MAADVFTQTISGKMVSLTNPKPEQIDIHDMVYSLCRVNRFNGNTKGIPYSVANHSWFAAQQVGEGCLDPEVVLAVLLHDAHEYILGDITTPAAVAIQATCSDLNPSNAVTYAVSKLKSNIDAAIWARLGLPPLSIKYLDKIRAVDMRMLATEKRDLLNKPDTEEPWRHIERFAPFDDEIVPIEPNEMFSLFYRELTRLVAEVKG